MRLRTPTTPLNRFQVVGARRRGLFLPDLGGEDFRFCVRVDQPAQIGRNVGPIHYQSVDANVSHAATFALTGVAGKVGHSLLETPILQAVATLSATLCALVCLGARFRLRATTPLRPARRGGFLGAA